MRGVVRGILAAVWLGASALAPAFAQPSPKVATAHGREIAQAQGYFADLVRAQGRELVVFDADGLVRPFGDAVMGRTWDTVPKGARGSFERIAEATGERRAFSMIVRTGGKVECRVGPTSPDQAWMNLLAAYSGQDRTAVAWGRLRLTSAVFQRFVLLHEIGHCTDPRAFDRDRDPVRNVMFRHKAETYGDTFAILQLAAEGVDQATLMDIVRVRSLYMSSSSLSSDAERRRKDAYPSDHEVAGFEHVPYWSIDAMKAAIAIAPRVRGASASAIAEMAHAIVGADGVTVETLIKVHRALAKESGFTAPLAEVAAAEAEHYLLSPGGTPQGERGFDRARWEAEFTVRLQAAASGDGPARTIASERDRLRGEAAKTVNAVDASAIESALGRLAELSMKGYAGVTDPPLVVSSTGGSTGRIPVAAMPAKIDTVGPVPTVALKDALDQVARPPGAGVQARMDPKAAVKAAKTARVALPPPPSRQMIAAPAARPPATSLASKPGKAGRVVAEALPPPKPDPIAEMTGISPAMARIRASEGLARR